jgi:hypothetical protein
VRIGPFGFDDEDEDEWWEAHSATIGRVDLVAQAANGSPGFLLMKSAAGGLMPPEAIRALMKENPGLERPMVAKKSYAYSSGGFRVTSGRPLTNGQLASEIRKAKAKAKMVAVYDASGRVVGIVSEDKITPVGSATAPGSAKAAPAKVPAPKPAPLVQPDATDGPAADAAEAVTKALAGVRWPTPRSFAKSAGTVDGRYQVLAKSLGKNEAGLLSDAVAVSALRFQFAHGVPGPEAVRIAKSIAVDVADAQARKPHPGVETGLAAMRATLKRPVR